jgi:hypothetical protein
MVKNAQKRAFLRQKVVFLSKIEVCKIIFNAMRNKNYKFYLKISKIYLAHKNIALRVKAQGDKVLN